MSITRLKNVPYAKNFIPKVFLDDMYLAWLYCGTHAWDAKNKIKTHSVLLPPNENPADYDWSFFRNQTVIANVLGHTDEIYRKRIALYLFRAGAKQVYFIMPKELQDFKIGDSIVVTELVSNHESYVR